MKVKNKHFTVALLGFVMLLVLPACGGGGGGGDGTAPLLSAEQVAQLAVDGGITQEADKGTVVVDTGQITTSAVQSSAVVGALVVEVYDSLGGRLTPQFVVSGDLVVFFNVSPGTLEVRVTRGEDIVYSESLTVSVGEIADVRAQEPADGNSGPSLLSGVWEAVEIQGALDASGGPLQVDGTVSTLTFSDDGTYTWFIHAPPFSDLDGNGTYRLDGSTLFVTGILTQLVSGNPQNDRLELTFNGDSSVSFFDDEADRWSYEKRGAVVGFSSEELAGKTFQFTDANYSTCVFDVSFNNNSQLVSSDSDGDIINYTIENGCITYTSDTGEGGEFCVESRNGPVITTEWVFTGGSFEDITDQWSIDFPSLSNDATALKDSFVTTGWRPDSTIQADGRVTNQAASFDGRWWIDNNVFYVDYPEEDGCVDTKAYKLENDRLMFATDARKTSTWTIVEK